MPTVLVVRRLMFIIHTRDHGHPHVTVYYGTPEDHEAMAKVRISPVGILESKHFSSKDLNFILAITYSYQHEWMEVWNEIHGKK